jgi:hypothetical protein
MWVRLCLEWKAAVQHDRFVWTCNDVAALEWLEQQFLSAAAARLLLCNECQRSDRNSAFGSAADRN